MSDDLVTNIVADATQFHAGANEVSAHAHALEHELKHIAGEIAGAFGVGLGIERFVEGIKGQIEKITELAHLSERTGIEVNELRALQYEAKRTGTDFETLQNSVKRMQVTLGEAVGGGSKGSEKRHLLKDLGLDPASLAAIDPAQAFAKIGDAIAAIENPTTRVHYAVELFGKNGAESLNVLMQGSEGLRKAMEKVGILTPEDIERVHQAHEGMLDLDASVQKLARSFAIELAPGIKDAAEAVKELIDNLGGHGKDDAGFMGGLGAGIRQAIFDIAGVDDKKAEFFGPSTATKPKPGSAIPVYEKMAAGWAAAEKAADDAEKEEEKDLEKAQRLLEKLFPEEKYTSDVQHIMELSPHLNEDQLNAALADAAKQFQEEIERHDPLKKMKEEAKHLLEEAELPEDKFEKALNEAAKGVNAGVLTESEFSKIRESQEEKLARAEGLGELIDGKNRFHEPTKIQGPEAITEGAAAYSAFFKGNQPSIDTEQARHTELLTQLVELQKRANEIEEGVGRKITPPPTPLSIN